MNEVRPLATSRQQSDPNHPYVYYLFSNGKYDKQATAAFSANGSTIHSDLLINSTVEATGKKVVSGLSQFVLFSLIPIGEGGLATDGALEVASTVGKEQIEKKVTQGVADQAVNEAADTTAGRAATSNVDDLGKLTAEARGVNTERLTEIVKNIGKDQKALSEGQLKSLVEASDINSSSKTTLLGGWAKDSSSYEQLAHQNGFNYYDMGDSYDALNAKIPGAGGDINGVWLQEKIDAGNEFVLSTDPYSPNIGKSYKEELSKLKASGYTIPNTPSTDGLWYITKGK